MDRIQLVEQLLHECTVSAAVVTGFLEKPRKYAVDDSLYMREVHFLVALSSKELPTMSDMANKLNVTQGAVTQMVTRLEKKGYVIRSKSSLDRRITTLSLTEKGRELCEQHIAYDRKEYSNTSEKLGEYSDEQLQELICYERKIQMLFAADQ